MASSQGEESSLVVSPVPPDVGGSLTQAPAQVSQSLTMPSESQVLDVLWPDDSSHPYVSMQVSTIDAWPVAVEYWPEIAAGALSLLLLIVLAAMLWRRWRRRRLVAPGEPYCAKCGYRLTGRSDAKQCPECGRDLAGGGVMYGRRLRRRPVVVAAALLVGVCGVYYAARGHLPRTGRAANWFDWPSARLHAWATANQRWSMMRHALPMLRIARIDPETGAVVRTVRYEPIQKRDGTRWNGRLAGLRENHFYLYWRSGVAEIDAGSGRTVRELPLPGTVGELWARISDIALHPSRDVLYAYVDYRVTLACDLQTGQWSEVVSFPERSQLLMHSLFALPDADTVILRRALAPRQPESGCDLIDLNSGQTVLTQRTAKHDLSQVVGVTGDELLLTETEFLAVAYAEISEQTIRRWSPGMREAEDLLTRFHCAASRRSRAAARAGCTSQDRASVPPPRRQPSPFTTGIGRRISSRCSCRRAPAT